MSRILRLAMAALMLAAALASPTSTEAKTVVKRHKFVVHNACTSANVEGAHINADDFTCKTGKDGSCVIDFPDYKNTEDVPVRVTAKNYTGRFHGHEALAQINVYDLTPVGGCKK